MLFRFGNRVGVSVAESIRIEKTFGDVLGAEDTTISARDDGSAASWTDLPDEDSKLVGDFSVVLTEPDLAVLEDDNSPLVVVSPRAEFVYRSLNLALFFVHGLDPRESGGVKESEPFEFGSYPAG